MAYKFYGPYIDYGGCLFPINRFLLVSPFGRPLWLSPVDLKIGVLHSCHPFDLRPWARFKFPISVDQFYNQVRESRFEMSYFWKTTNRPQIDLLFRLQNNVQMQYERAGVETTTKSAVHFWKLVKLWFHSIRMIQDQKRNQNQFEKQCMLLPK